MVQQFVVALQVFWFVRIFMKIVWKDDFLFEISDIQKRVIMDSKCCKDFDECNKDLGRRINWAIDKAKAFKPGDDEYIKKRIHWVVNEVYSECYKRLKAKWEPKLAKAGVESIPVDEDKFAELVFAQPDYKDRSARDSIADKIGESSALENRN